MVHTDAIWNNVLEVITAKTFFKAKTVTGTLFIFETMLCLFILNCGENNEKQGRFMVRLIRLIGILTQIETMFLMYELLRKI